jgi:UDP-N-acetyl-D-mannosaminuronic acid dehydrogenase
MNNKVCVVGMGHAGLPILSVIAETGLITYGYDIDSNKIELLSKGINPIPQEPGVQEIINKTLNKNLFFSNNLTELKEKVNCYIIIVPLFISENKVPDFSILDSAFKSVGRILKKDDLVVLETTVPPKTTEDRFKTILEKESNLIAGKDFYLSYSPERIMTGDSIDRLKNMPKVISGYDKVSLDKIKELYSLFNSKLYCANNMREAELTKVLEGVFRDVNLAIANECYKICEMYDVDYSHLRKGANQNPYCNLLIPGIGVSGHCIPVYPWFVIQDGFKKDIYFELTHSARKLMIQWLIIL